MKPSTRERDFQDGALWALDQLKVVVTARREILSRVRPGLQNDLSSVISSISELLEGIWLDTSQAVTTRMLSVIRARTKPGA